VHFEHIYLECVPYDRITVSYRLPLNVELESEGETEHICSLQRVPVNAEPATTACRHSSEKGVISNAEEPLHAARRVPSYVGLSVQVHLVV
jgi:hypothetical protein